MKDFTPEQFLVESARRIRPARDAALVVAGFLTFAVLLIALTAVLLRNVFVFDAHERAEEFALRAAAEVRPDDVPKPTMPRVAVDLTDHLKSVIDDSSSIRQIRAYSLDDEVESRESGDEADADAEARRIRFPIANRVRTGLLHVEETLSGLLRVPTLLTSYAPVADETGAVVGMVAVDVEPDRLHHRMHLLWLGLASGMIVAVIGATFLGRHVYRVRASAAKTALELAQAREIEQLAVEGLGEILYERPVDGTDLVWRGNPMPSLGRRVPEMPTELAGWQAWIHPEDAPRVAAERAKSDKTGHALTLEYRVRHANSHYRWLLDRAVLTGSSQRQAWIGALVDVTVRKDADKALRDFIEQNPTAHIVFAGDDLVDANPAAVRAFGVADLGELLAIPMWKLWPKVQPDGAHSAEAWSNHVLTAMDHVLHHFEWTFVTPTGSPLAMDVFLNQAHLDGREVLLMACYDLSDIKQAQAQLVLSEERFRDVSEAVGEYIWEVDEAGLYTFVSPRVQEVTGRSPEEVLGRHPFDYIPEEDLESVRQRSAEIVASGQSYGGFEHRFRHAHGTILWISVTGVPRVDAEGNVVGYRGATLDVTQRRAYEEELVLQKEAAEAAARTKSEFLAMMSHEIRTPLNSVLGFTDLILHTPLNPTQRDYLDTIRRSGDALLVLLNDILDFSKIESGRMTIDPQPTELRLTVAHVLEMYRPACDRKGLALHAHFHEDVPTWLRTDPARLRQILINLVGNAVKFTPTGNVRVRASMRASGDSGSIVRFEVSDTGIGIRPYLIDRLFQPFSQADSSTTRQFGGTGLGLAISKRLAQLLDGDIGILATSGSGTTFYLDLPAVIPAASELASLPPKDTGNEPPRGNAAEFRPLRVLVVDDNASNRKLTTRMLEQLGETSEAAASAEECFEKLEAAEFDVVLMDVQMPEIDGLRATEMIRRNEAALGRESIRIIALTAGAMSGDREACLEAGMDGYLAKPIRREALVAILDEARAAGAA